MTWTNDKNERRCDLIDREISGAITSEEREELNILQEQMLAHRHKVAPLPSLAELIESFRKIINNKTFLFVLWACLAYIIDVKFIEFDLGSLGYSPTKPKLYQLSHIITCGQKRYRACVPPAFIGNNKHVFLEADTGIEIIISGEFDVARIPNDCCCDYVMMY